MRYSFTVLASLAATTFAYPADVSIESRGSDIGIGLGGGAGGSVGGSVGGDAGAGASGSGSIGADIGGGLDIGGLISGILGLGGHATSAADILGDISAHGAAALEGAAIGCAATAIHADARAELKAWLKGQAAITGSLKTSLLAWAAGTTATLEADVLAALSVFIPAAADIAAQAQLYVTIEGISPVSELEAALVLSASAQAQLSAWLKGAAGLSVEVSAALKLIAAGGYTASLSADVKAALVAWVHGGSCTLSASLKAAVIALLDAKAGVDVVAIGTLSETALTAVSVGASVAALVEESGILTAGAQASLEAFLKAGVELEADVKAGLEACASGKAAAGLSVDIRTALAVWISGSSCSLGVELKAVVLLWLSLAASAEASVNLVTGLVGDILGFLTETVFASLSIDLRGALGLLAAGESIAYLSFETIAEISAFLGGCTEIDIGINIELIIIEWLTGCSLPGAPAPKPGSTSSVPVGGATSTVSVGATTSATTIISSIPAPSGPAPSGPAPSGPAPSGPAPSGPAPSGPAPSGPAPSGPAPSGPAPSGPAPSGPAPSGPAPSGPAETPAVPSGASPTGASPSPSSGGGVPWPSGGGSGSDSGSGSGSGSGGVSGGGSGGGSGSGSVSGSGSGSGGVSGGASGSGSAGGAPGAPAPTSPPTVITPAPNVPGAHTSTVTVTKTVCPCDQ